MSGDLGRTFGLNGKWWMFPILLLLFGCPLILYFNHKISVVMTTKSDESAFIPKLSSPQEVAGKKQSGGNVVVITKSDESAFIPKLSSPQELAGKKHSGLTLLNYTPIEIKPEMNIVQKHDTLVSLAQQPQVICHKWEMYGNKGDGGWPVCLAPKLLPKTPCVVYSYGIQNDWSFDDAYHKKHQCTLRTFDPSMGKTKEHEHSKDVLFYPLGLSDKEETIKSGWKMFTHKQLLNRFKETNITLSYLKFDIESSEFQVLQNMIKDGVLKYVMQLSFEIHVKNPIYGGAAEANVRNMFDAVKGLEALGFRRWFYHHRLNGFPFQCDQSFININYL